MSVGPIASPYPSQADGANLVGYGDTLAVDSPDGGTGTTGAMPPDFAALVAGQTKPYPVESYDPGTYGTGQPGGVPGLVGKGLDYLQRTQQKSDDYAVRAATGRLTDVHDYMIAATEASLVTELTVAIRNRAVDAFNEIMRMQA
jgi:flagellar hook-basal body complex protein FliE